MSSRVYQCQDCGFTDTDKTQFKIVKFKNIGLVHCIDCVRKLQERLATPAPPRKDQA